MVREVIITANGKGERMKEITDQKFSLFFRDKRILEHLLDTFPDATILTYHKIPYVDQKRIKTIPKTNTRKETLQFIREKTNVLIVDADIYIEDKLDISRRDNLFQKDVLFIKKSRGRIINSGLYFVRSVGDLVDRMEADEIIMDDYNLCLLNTIHLGTPEEYNSAR